MQIRRKFITSISSVVRIRAKDYVIILSQLEGKRKRIITKKKREREEGLDEVRLKEILLIDQEWLEIDNNLLAYQ